MKQVSGHNKYQTILCIVIFSFVIILIVCLFGNFLGLNSHFQKITASIKTLLPAALPAVAQAATITHGYVKLHIDYFDILMYAIQIMLWQYYLLLFGYVYSFGIVLIPEIFIN